MICIICKLYTYVVNDILFGVRLVCPRRVHGTHNVHLVVFERLVSFVHVNYVIRVVYPESETVSFTWLVTRFFQDFGYFIHTVCNSFNSKHSIPHRVNQRYIFFTKCIKFL